VTVVHGVDFSGAAEPGEDVWLTTGEWNGDRLTVTAARSAREAFGTTDREGVLSGLVGFVRDRPGEVVGVDVSFGLPRPVLPAVDSWAGSVRWVTREFGDDDALTAQAAWKDRARASEADGVELKRATDRPVGASSPYSFITRHQTFHALVDVLAPLLGDVAVEPMLSRDTTTPTLVETYPAGTLRRLDLPDRRYKDDRKYENAPARRERILEGLLDQGVDLPEGARGRYLGDPEGDAVDSLVACVATARALEAGFAVEDERYDPLEGYIYV
jgi:hypothetical protein